MMESQVTAYNDCNNISRLVQSLLQMFFLMNNKYLKLFCEKIVFEKEALLLLNISFLTKISIFKVPYTKTLC